MKRDEEVTNLATVPEATERTESVAFPSHHFLLLILGIPCKMPGSGIPGTVSAEMRLGAYFPDIPLIVTFYV